MLNVILTAIESHAVLVLFCENYRSKDERCMYWEGLISSINWQHHS